MNNGRKSVLIVVLVTSCYAIPIPTALSQSNSSVQLLIESPTELSGVAEQVRTFDAAELASVMRLTGTNDPGAPIRTLLLSEQSTTAQNTPSWVAGFADPQNDVVIIFPDRIGSYPYRSLEGVLFHEVAHILISRTANGRSVPRWFNEGLASAAEQSWSLEDRSRFAWELFLGSDMTITQLESLFDQSHQDVARAYVISEALVRYILQRYGSFAAAGVLNRMGSGASFESALYVTTGLTISEHLDRFWESQMTWKYWINFAGHPFTLWGFSTLLAIVAIWRHRQRRRERRRQWEMEEEWETSNLGGTPPKISNSLRAVQRRMSKNHRLAGTYSRTLPEQVFCFSRFWKFLGCHNTHNSTSSRQET